MIALFLLLFAALQNPAPELATIQKELGQAEDAFYGSLDKVPQAEREKAYSDWAKKQEGFYARAEEFALAHPNEESACEAFVWVVTRAGPGERTARCFERALADFPKSERLSQIPPAFVYVDQLFVDEWYARLSSEERPAKVRGSALYASAQHRLRAINGARRLREDSEIGKRMRESSSKDWIAKLEALDPEAETKAVDELLERVRTQFTDVDSGRGKLGELAAASLHELRDLAIGKLAPEIAGSDVEGVAFKLSDYRGKVVLLDFWGNW